MKKEKNIIGNNIKKVKQKMPMVFYLSVFIFAISCVTAIIAFFLYVIFVNAGFMTEITLIWLVLVLLFGSVVISTSLVRGLGNKIIFGSLRQITRASKAVANGDFSQRLEPPREKEIAELRDILGNKRKLKNVIIAELKEVAEKYGQPRKTEIIY